MFLACATPSSFPSSSPRRPLPNLSHREPERRERRRRGRDAGPPPLQSVVDLTVSSPGRRKPQVGCSTPAAASAAMGCCGGLLPRVAQHLWPPVGGDESCDGLLPRVAQHLWPPVGGDERAVVVC
jgi:hypothetical protein